MKILSPKFSRNLTCRKYKGNIGEAAEQEERLCDDEETVSEFTYLGDRVSAGEGCEAAVTAGTRCRWIKLSKCCELLYGRRFPLTLKWAVYWNYVGLSMLYGIETWCLMESEMGIL